MATTKKNTRPKISSSHAAASRGGKRPAAPKKPARKTAAAPAKPARPKRPAEKPSRTAMRTERAAAGAPSRPRKAPAEQRTPSPSQEASQSLALRVAKAALDKKAVNVQIVDVVGRVDYADYLVVMSGRSDRHVLAVADSIEDELRRLVPKRKPIAVEGKPQGNWVVLDFGEVVAHVFQEDARSFYDLDNLWQDARKVPVPREEGAPLSSAS